MLAAVPVVVCNKPATDIPFFSQTKPARSAIKFATTHKVSSGSSVLWRSDSLNFRGWIPNTMAESIKSSVLRVSRDDESVGAFEQETFIDGSSEFSSNFSRINLEVLFNRLSKWLVTAVFATVLLVRQDAEAMWAATGSIVNGGLSVILKQILNQERPATTSKSDPGMPSSHAQSIFFTVVFSILSMVQWLGMNGLTAILSGLILVFGSYLSWLRFSLQFHTISQIVVGAVVGSTFSILWFWLWNAIVSEAFISYLWLRIIVVLGAFLFCVGFLLYVIKHWFKDEAVDLVKRIMKS